VSGKHPLAAAYRALCEKDESIDRECLERFFQNTLQTKSATDEDVFRELLWLRSSECDEVDYMLECYNYMHREIKRDKSSLA